MKGRTSIVIRKGSQWHRRNSRALCEVTQPDSNPVLVKWPDGYVEPMPRKYFGRADGLLPATSPAVQAVVS